MGWTASVCSIAARTASTCTIIASTGSGSAVNNNSKLVLLQNGQFLRML